MENTPMKTLTALLALLAALLGACATNAFAHGPANARHRVVIQVSDADPGKWKLALNNARNVQHDLGAQNVDIEIVAYGPGIGMLQAESAAAGGVIQVMTDGIRVVACENTMHNLKLERQDMQGGIGYVKAGVVEIMRRQQEGWAYVRP